MEVALPEEHRMLRDTVRGFIDEHLRPLEQQVDQDDDIDPQVMRSLRQEALKLGLYANNMPESVGGRG